MNNEKYAVYERKPAHGSTKNGMILGPFNSKEEAQSNGEKYGYTGDNYYVNSVNNEKMNQLIELAWKKYADSHFTPGNPNGKLLSEQLASVRPMMHNRESFRKEIFTNPSFASQWGLKIEERELSWEEKVQWVMKNTDVEWENFYIVEEAQKESTPTTIITITYNDETVEIYE